MKKLIFTILASLALAACSTEVYREETSQYIDKSVILGSWYKIDGWDSIQYNFGKTSVSDVTYDKYTQKVKRVHSYKSYNLTEDRILFNNSKRGNPYYIVKDTLFLGATPDADPLGKYTRVKL